jgi:hypothetical protein
VQRCASCRSSGPPAGSTGPPPAPRRLSSSGGRSISHGGSADRHPVGWNARGLQSCVRWLGRPAPPAASRPTAPDRCPSTYGSGGGSAPGPACSNPWLPGRASPAEFASLGRPGVDATEVRDARAHSTRHARRQGRRARDHRRPWRDSSGDRATRAISAWRWSPLMWCCSPGRANHILRFQEQAVERECIGRRFTVRPRAPVGVGQSCDTSSRAQMHQPWEHLPAAAGQLGCAGVGHHTGDVP